MPGIRFTICRMMVAVLVAALAAWWFVGRPAGFRRTARYHRDQYRAHTTIHEERYGSRTLLISNTTLMGEWHLIMARRYTRAAEHPWKPAGPDPMIGAAGAAVGIIAGLASGIVVGKQRTNESGIT